MDSVDFINREESLLEDLRRFVEQCDEFEVDAKERLDDLVFRAVNND